VDAHNGAVQGLYSVVIADFHHFTEEKDPDPQHSERWDPDPHQNEKMDPDNIKVRRLATLHY
jgi:hypothetical protein